MHHEHRPGLAIGEASTDTTNANSTVQVCILQSDLRLIAEALQEYVEACQLGAEMAAGRDETLRQRRIQQSAAAETLGQAFRRAAA